MITLSSRGTIYVSTMVQRCKRIFKDFHRPFRNSLGVCFLKCRSSTISEGKKPENNDQLKSATRGVMSRGRMNHRVVVCPVLLLRFLTSIRVCISVRVLGLSATASARPTSEAALNALAFSNMVRWYRQPIMKVMIFVLHVLSRSSPSGTAL